MKQNKLDVITFHTTLETPKGWGKEVIVNRQWGEEGFPLGYTGKLLVYDKQNALSSMHFHTKKHETFYVLEGIFKLNYFHPQSGDMFTKELKYGDVVVIPPCNPHQLQCLTGTGTIVEFSTFDYEWDNFRIGRGDSQNLLHKKV